MGHAWGPLLKKTRQTAPKHTEIRVLPSGVVSSTRHRPDEKQPWPTKGGSHHIHDHGIPDNQHYAKFVSCDPPFY